MDLFRILIVDDEPDNLELTRIMLERPGIAVELAHNGREAVERCHLEGRRYDLVVMDLLMPVMDGEEAIRLLRTHVDTRDVPILVSTAKRGAEDTARARRAGADAVLLKPFRRAELVGAVQALLAMRHVASPIA